LAGQQPVDETVPVIPRPFEPRPFESVSLWVPVSVVPVHGPESEPVDVEPIDRGVGMGLTPAFSISVEPSGMLALVVDDPGVKSGDAMPVEEIVAVEVPGLQPLAVIPPPSKVEVDRLAADWVI
jgi:hypothetical protein